MDLKDIAFFLRRNDFMEIHGVLPRKKPPRHGGGEVL
jgi:hypothetical protein